MTPRSLRLRTGDGRALERRVQVNGAMLEVWPRVHQGLLDHPPESLVLELQGAPSLHALGAVDGRLLSGSRRWELPLHPGLSVGPRGSPRLVSVNGLELGAPGMIRHAGHLRLRLQGRVDPGSVRPSACVVFPVAGELTLDPLEPDVHWWLEGDVFELLMTLPPGTGAVELRTRRLGITSAEGDAVEPLATVVIEPQVSPSSEEAGPPR